MDRSGNERVEGNGGRGHTLSCPVTWDGSAVLPAEDMMYSSYGWL